eukprot:13551170-Alexandrium_andersonii.AAC.1
MVITTMMVMARMPMSAQTRSPELSRVPFCADVRAECAVARRTFPELRSVRFVWLRALCAE